MKPHPKPPPREKAPRKPIARKGRPKKGNAYTRPEWRALVAQVRKRSKGICEARVCCAGDPVDGDPHHQAYADFKGWKRLIVPLDDMIDCCRACHLSFHPE